MELAEIEQFAKQKKKEHRMKIGNINEVAVHQKKKRQDKKARRILLEKIRYESFYCGKE